MRRRIEVLDSLLARCFNAGDITTCASISPQPSDWTISTYRQVRMLPDTRDPLVTPLYKEGEQ